MTGPGAPARYQIRVEGVLDSRWATWFGNLQIEDDGSQTTMSGSFTDQAALHGVLAKVRDLGLTLTSVHRLDQPARPDPQPGQPDDRRPRPTGGRG
jgi:hypothetical protein